MSVERRDPGLLLWFRAGHDGRVTATPRTIFYTAASIDGFIATPENSLDWLFTQQIDQQGPMGYEPFIQKIGALAMGATTYAWIMRHSAETGEPWAYDIPCWVFTHRHFEVPEKGDIRFTKAAIPHVHKEMTAAAGGRDLWIVGGGDLAGQFADHGLLDEITVCCAPVTLGAGAPLLPRRLDLRLAETARNGDFVCATYDVLHP